MPYKRRYKRRYKKKYYGRKPDTFDVAREAWRGVQKLKRIVNAEYKHHPFTEVNILANQAWGIRALSNIQQGDNQEQRDGISVKPLNLTIKVQMKVTSGTKDNSFIQRIIILRGKHENGDGLTELIQAYEDGVAGIDDYQRFKRIASRFNSKTLHDKYYKLEATNTVSSQCERIFQFNIKLDGHIGFGTGTNNPQNGGLYMLFAANETDVSSVMNINSRLSFTDN